MNAYRAFELKGHVWIPADPHTPDHVYGHELTDFFARMRVLLDALPMKVQPSVGPTLDSKLDVYAPPWLVVDQMWANQLKARAVSTTETLLYERLLRSHYQNRYSSNSVKSERTRYG